MIRYAQDHHLAYAASRHAFEAGIPLSFDESYRLAHLPLVAPTSPAVIARKHGLDCNMGHYVTPKTSIVLPIDYDVLVSDAKFLQMNDELQRASFNSKIAWPLCDQRKDKLHATLVSGLKSADAACHQTALIAATANLLPLSFEMKGLFLGKINTGRMYLPVYPQMVSAENFLSKIQIACGSRCSYFYAVGYYNFVEELDADETMELSALLSKWQNTVVSTQPAKALWIMQTNDDLVLSARVISTIRPPYSNSQ